MTNRSETTASDDAALIERCRAGDSTAWRLLVERYNRLVYSIAHRQGLDPSACDDVAQETFSILVQRLPELRRETALPKWLMVTTLNVARSWGRRNRRTAPSQDDATASDDNQTVRLEREETILQVRQALQRLGGRCEALLRILYQQGDTPSYQEIAHLLGMPIGAIGPTRARCLEKLLRIWRSDASDDAR